jgi:drug/metabolite transporter (DMT)-like permease
VSGARPFDYVVLAALWLIWGSAWPVMRVVFAEWPVWQYRAVSAAVAALVLLGVARLAGGRIAVPRRQWPALVAAAILNIAAWNVLTGYGLRMIGAGHAAVVCYTMPIWTAVLAAIVLGEKLTGRRLAALALGAAGVGVLLSHDFAALGADPVGFALVLGAAVAWAVGTIVTKRVAWTPGLPALVGWQLAITAAALAPFALTLETLALPRISLGGALAAAYVLLFGVIAGYLCWFRVVAAFPATVATIGAMVIPAIGTIGGALALGEPLGWREGAALALTLSAVALVMAPARKARAGASGGAGPPPLR